MVPLVHDLAQGELQLEQERRRGAHRGEQLASAVLPPERGDDRTALDRRGEVARGFGQHR